ncbi:MAG TPA: cell division protein ZapD [Gammaproteobacteria bacterium]|nr:cell division protein ZapD [Gammaproteobacteria bacterium]
MFATFAVRDAVAQNTGMNTAAEMPASSPEHGLIRFEQPLSERMRTFLRIEFLYEQLLFHVDEPTEFGSRAAIAALLEILTILGRGDVRSDVSKELERHADLLGRYRSQPGVDPARLTGLIDNIEDLRSQIAEAGAQAMNPLKECDFLNTIRHRSAIPGGTCMFDLPDYGYWLHLPAAERRRQLEDWTARLKPICEAVAEVLWLTREANEASECVGTGGFYQHSVDRSETLNLVRVLLPGGAGVFPEISAGPHRFTVRFLKWRGVDTRPMQVNQDVRFLLALC